MATSITNTSITTDDLTVDTNTISVDSTNNRVGIGTSSPSKPLHVSLPTGSGATPRATAVAVIDGNDNTQLDILGGASSILGINFGDSSDNDQARITSNTTPGSKDMAFTVNAGVRMTIDTAGIITKPNQPSFLMKKYSGGSNAISVNSVWTFDEALSNVGSHANISNGRFTAPVAGTYCFMWHNIGEGASTVYRSFIRKNGSGSWGTGSYRLESRNYHSQGYPNASAQVVVTLAATDYVDIYLEGGAIYSDATNGVWFCGFLIG